MAAGAISDRLHSATPETTCKCCPPPAVSITPLRCHAVAVAPVGRRGNICALHTGCCVFRGEMYYGKSYTKSILLDTALATIRTAVK
jgi:hypothetical protein